MSSLPWLLLSRALLGLAVGGIMTTTVTLIADYYEGEQRGAMMGQQAAFMGLGGVFFVTLGGLLADVSWRAPFGIYLLAFLQLPLILLFLDEPESRGRASGQQPEAAAVPWSKIALLCTLAFSSMAIFYMIPVQIPFYIEALGESSHSKAGFAIAAFSLSSAFASMCYRAVGTRLGSNSIFAVGFVGLGAGYTIIALSTGYTTVLCGLLVAGAGMGLVPPNINILINTYTPAPVRGRAMGILTACVFLGQFLSPILTVPVVDRVSLSSAFGLAGASLGMLAMLFLYIRSRRASTGFSEERM